MAYKEKNHIEFGKRVDDKDNFNWKKVDTSEISLKKPVVLCFGGANTRDDREANYLGSLTQKLLGVNANYVDIYSACYKYGFNAFVDEGLLKLFEQNISQNGKRLEFDEAIKNMRNINIFSHCFGQKMVDLLLKETAKFMQSLGYTKSETQEVLSQVYHVSYAPLKDKPSAFSTNVEFRSFSDFFLNKKNRNLFGDEIFEPYINSLTISVKDNTTRLFSNFFVSNKSVDDHQLKNLTDFLYDKSAPPRAKFVLENLSVALAFGVTNSQINFKNGKFDFLITPEQFVLAMRPAIEKVNQSNSEQKQKKEWERKREKIRQVTYGDSDLELKSIINGKISIEDVEDIENFSPKKLNIKPLNEIGKLTEAKYGYEKKITPKIAQADNCVNCMCTKKCFIILKDGDFLEINTPILEENEKWKEDSVVSLRCNKFDTNDAVILAIDTKTAKAILESCINFKEKEFESVDELYNGLEKGKNKNLSKKQTRIVFNEMMLNDIEMKNLKTDLTLDADVLKNEIKLEKGLIVPKNNEVSF